MFKIAICEDKKVHLEINKFIIKKWSEKNNISVIIREYCSAEEFIFKELDNLDLDCVLLDIEMKNINGIELATKIRQKDKSIGLVFITGIDEFMSVGYDLDAIHYLIKPIKQEKLFECLDKVWQKIKFEKSNSNNFIVKRPGQITKVKMTDIMYFESYQHYVDVHTTQEVYTIKKNLYELEDELDKNKFIRCHKSYIVNVFYINEIKNNNLILDNEEIVPVSKKRKEAVKELYFSQV